MNFLANLKNAASTPIVPYNSLYIDSTFQDLFKAIRTPAIASNLDFFIPKPYDINTTCYGCRVRQIHGITPDHDSLQYESCNDIHMRLQKNSWSKSYIKNESASTVHYDLASLWARPYINGTIEERSQSPKTAELQRTNPLCQACSLQSRTKPPQNTRPLSQTTTTTTTTTATTTSMSTTTTTPTTPSPTTVINVPYPVPHAYNVLSMLSVRSALSSWLFFKDFPKGSIVIFSAINIPDMAKVIAAHGLIPLPIDIDTNTTMIDMEVLERTIQHYGAITQNDNKNQHQQNDKNENQNGENDNLLAATTPPKICAVIVSYIFGIRNDISPLINLVHKHGLPFIEDCAEAYTDVNFGGHPDSDLTLFSFGSIKNCTAFGGGIARVKSFDEYYGMLYIQTTWPRYTNQKYYEKVTKMLPVSLALNSPLTSETVYRTAKLVGFDVKEFMVSKLRGFPGDMVFGIRHQPPISLLYVLRHRISHINNESLHLAAQKGNYFEGLIQKYDLNLEIVGRYAEKRGYWLFPVIVTNPEQITNELDQRGVQVYRGATQLACLQVPEILQQNSVHITHSSTPNTPKGISYTIPAQIQYAQQLMKHVIYLPISKNTPNHVIEIICKHLQSICGINTANSSNNLNSKDAKGSTIIQYPTLDPGIKRRSEISAFQLAARL